MLFSSLISWGLLGIKGDTSKPSLSLLEGFLSVKLFIFGAMVPKSLNLKQWVVGTAL